MIFSNVLWHIFAYNLYNILLLFVGIPNTPNTREEKFMYKLIVNIMRIFHDYIVRIWDLCTRGLCNRWGKRDDAVD